MGLLVFVCTNGGYSKTYTNSNIRVKDIEHKQPRLYQQIRSEHFLLEFHNYCKTFYINELKKHLDNIDIEVIEYDPKYSSICNFKHIIQSHLQQPLKITSFSKRYILDLLGQIERVEDFIAEKRKSIQNQATHTEKEVVTLITPKKRHFTPNKTYLEKVDFEELRKNLTELNLIKDTHKTNALINLFDANKVSQITWTGNKSELCYFIMQLKENRIIDANDDYWAVANNSLFIDNKDKPIIGLNNVYGKNIPKNANQIQLAIENALNKD